MAPEWRIPYLYARDRASLQEYNNQLKEYSSWNATPVGQPALPAKLTAESSRAVTPDQIAAAFSGNPLLAEDLYLGYALESKSPEKLLKKHRKMAISAYNLSLKASGNLSPLSPDKSTLTVELDKLAAANMNADKRVKEEERYVKQVLADTVISEAAKARWAELSRSDGKEEEVGDAKEVPVPEDKTAGNGSNPVSPPSPAAGESFTDPLVGKFIRVKGGTFTMGCTHEQGSYCYDDEKPVHEVTLSDYYIGETEVTQAQWRAVMGNNPSNFTGCDECPVERVSWNDVKDFISKLNSRSGGVRYRLPTEAEWEYAARGGGLSKGYKYAGSDNPEEVAWYDDNWGSKTHPVKGKKANELGIYDMSGNVWEWCSDWKDNYSSGSQTNPTGPNTGDDRVRRGGGWFSNAGYCRVSGRNFLEPGNRAGSLGFRLASSAPR
jgi:formylglycine-generating enzyme required for sulfatase activity